MNLSSLQNGSDIRGIALGEHPTLTPKNADVLSRAFVVWLAKQTKKSQVRVAVGMDSRLSGPSLKQACLKALQDSGVFVIDCGMASTPAMFMTTVSPHTECDGAIMITASHLPSDRNGMKFFTTRGGLESSEIKQLIALAETPLPHGLQGSVSSCDFISLYAANLRQKIISETGCDQPLAGLNIIVDAGNGAGGFFADRVLAPLGADTSGSQFLEPDGHFPNHIPNPENAQAMESLVQAVQKHNADFGLIFDTDVDRVGAVDKGGVVVNKNRLIAVISAILLREAPGATIVTDSITSTGLAQFIQAHGGKHHRFKRGYKNVINEAISLNQQGFYTPLAIETSGHAALKENYFLDDGAYLAIRLLIEVARLHQNNQGISDLLSTLAEPEESIEFRLPIRCDDFVSYGQRLIGRLTEYAEKDPAFSLAPNNYEGVRVQFGPADGDGWFLLRLSLHEPLIAINIESDRTGGCQTIARRLFDFLQPYTELDLSPLADSLC